MLKTYSMTDIGRKRKLNQDTVYTCEHPLGNLNNLFIVADGMGGHEKGEVASGIIVDKVKEAWEDFFGNTAKKCRFKDAFNAISNAIKEANREIFYEYNKDAVCGSTVVVLLLVGNEYGVISVGDSRLYSFQKDELKQITKDDVWENLPEQQGLTLSELKASPKFGKLTNAVGTMRDVKINYLTGRIKKNIVFLLCSDGVYKLYKHQELSETIKEHGKEPETVTKIIKDKVYSAGARDNLSAIVVDVHTYGLFAKNEEIMRSDDFDQETTEEINDNSDFSDNNDLNQNDTAPASTGIRLKTGIILFTVCVLILAGIIVFLIYRNGEKNKVAEVSNQNVEVIDTENTMTDEESSVSGQDLEAESGEATVE